MAEDSGGGGSSSANKLTFTLDLDSKQFTMKLNDVEQQIGGMGEKGKTSFQEMSAAMTPLNQGLELLKKGLHLAQEAFEQMSKTDTYKNQETAFRNLANSVGANADILLTAVVKAADGTITRTQAMKDSFKLLNAGMRADQIPTLIEYADKMEKASGGVRKMEDLVDALANGLESGMAPRLKAFGLQVSTSGTRADAFNQVLTQLKSKAEGTGETFATFGEKASTAISSITGKAGRSVGDVLERMLIPLFGDKADKALQNVELLQKKLKDVNAAAERGATSFEVYDKGMSQIIPIQEAQATLTRQLTEAQHGLHTAHEEEKKDLTDLTEKIGGGAKANMVLMESQKARAESEAKVMMIQQRAADEAVEFGHTQIQTYKDIAKAKAELIDRKFEEEKAQVVATATNANKLKDDLVAIEARRYDAIRALRVSDEEASMVQANAEMQFLDQNLLTMEGAQSRFLEAKTQRENADYALTLERLRNMGLDQDAYFKAVEDAQVAHEAKIKEIKDTFAALTEKNMQVGFTTALNGMKKDATNFATFTEDATKKTKNLMVNSFVEAAKGHGNAMELMTAQFLEMIGTKMIESGTFHLLNGIWPVNPAELGQGAALIAAGSALVGASASMAPSSGGGGGDSGGAAAGISRAPDMAQQDQIEKKKATIVINGNLLNSRDTADYLADLLRTNSDVTDYNVVAVGGRSYS